MTGHIEEPLGHRIEALATNGQELVVLIGELPFIASDRLTERLVDGDGQIGSIRRSRVHVDRPQMVINPITHPPALTDHDHRATLALRCLRIQLKLGLLERLMEDVLVVVPLAAVRCVNDDAAHLVLRRRIESARQNHLPRPNAPEADPR